MEGTTLGSYLIIARYNRENWNTLDRLVPQQSRVLGSSGKQQTVHKQAEEAAEKLFPEKAHKKSTNKGVLGQATSEVSTTGVESGEAAESTEHSLPYPPGVLLVKSFHSGIHADVFTQIPDILSDKVPTEEEKAAWRSTLEGIFRDFKASDKNAPNTHEKDPGVGWVAVIHPASFEDFVQMMGGKDGPLWKMYDISIIPLNNDQTTDDIYKYMTPSNWKT